MKAAQKVDARTNRERQAAYRRDMREAGWKKVSFYLSPQEHAELQSYLRGNQLGYAMMVAIRESKYLRRHVAEVTGWEKFM